MVGLLGDWLEGGWGGWTKPVVKSLYLRQIFKKAGADDEGPGSVKKRVLTARTELRNCLFAPVGGGKKMPRHYCFHFAAKHY